MVILLAAGATAGAQGQGKQEKGPVPPALKLAIPAFPDGGQIPARNTCFEPKGGVSPAMQWTNVPPGTVSFAIILHDLDGSLRNSSNDTVHWTLWNFPGTATELPEDQPPRYNLDEGLQGNTVNMKPGYFPPCPPINTHHYMFELYALDTTVNLPPTAGRPELLKEMQGHVVGKAVYVGLAHR